MKLRGHFILHQTAHQRAHYIYKRGVWFEQRRDAFTRINAECQAIEHMIPQAEAAGDAQAVNAFKARMMELQQIKFDNA